MPALSETLLPLEKEKTSSIFMDNYETDIPLFGESSNVIILIPYTPPLSVDAKKTISKLQSFKELVTHWDSYGTIKPSEKTISEAISFVKQLDDLNIFVYFTAPGPSGEIVIELKNNQKEVEIFFNPENSNEVYFYKNNECLHEGTLQKSWNKLIKFIL